MTSPVCTGESYDPEDMQCQSCPARNRCPVESTTSAEQVLGNLITWFNDTYHFKWGDDWLLDEIMEHLQKELRSERERE